MLEQFIKQYGFEAILNERGNIAYGSDDKPEAYAYKEIENCDILVAIVGARFGTESTEGGYSISQRELKVAHDLDKQIHIFVDKNVFTELQTYLRNKDVTGFVPAYGDPKVYVFLEEVERFSKNNGIASFETPIEIVDYLREQWAGLFHRFLAEKRVVQEMRTIEDLKGVTRSLEGILQALSEQVTSQAKPIQEILLSIHPAFEAVRSALGIKHRVYFTDKSELDALLKAYGYEEQYNPFVEEGDDYMIEYERPSKTATLKLFVWSKLFDVDKKLQIISPNHWKEEYLNLFRKPRTQDDEYDPFANE